MTGLASGLEGALGAWAVTAVSATTGGVIGLVAGIAEVLFIYGYDMFVATDESEQILVFEYKTVVTKLSVVMATLIYLEITAPATVTAIVVSTVALPLITYFGLSKLKSEESTT